MKGRHRHRPGFITPFIAMLMLCSWEQDISSHASLFAEKDQSVSQVDKGTPEACEITGSTAVKLKVES